MDVPTFPVVFLPVPFSYFCQTLRTVGTLACRTVLSIARCGFTAAQSTSALKTHLPLIRKLPAHCPYLLSCCIASISQTIIAVPASANTAISINTRMNLALPIIILTGPKFLKMYRGLECVKCFRCVCLFLLSYLGPSDVLLLSCISLMLP